MSEVQAVDGHKERAFFRPSRAAVHTNSQKLWQHAQDFKFKADQTTTGTGRWAPRPPLAKELLTTGGCWERERDGQFALKVWIQWSADTRENVGRANWTQWILKKERREVTKSEDGRKGWWIWEEVGVRGEYDQNIVYEILNELLKNCCKLLTWVLLKMYYMYFILGLGPNFQPFLNNPTPLCCI